MHITKRLMFIFKCLTILGWQLQSRVEVVEYDWTWGRGIKSKAEVELDSKEVDLIISATYMCNATTAFLV